MNSGIPDGYPARLRPDFLFYRTDPFTSNASISIVAQNAQQEQAVRALFERERIAAFMDFAPSNPVSGYTVRNFTYSVPCDVALVVRLTTDVLRSVYGVSEEAGLNFDYCEMDALG